MKKYILLISVLLIIATSVIAQTKDIQNNFLEKKAISLQVTNAQIALEFKAITGFKLGAELGLGIATLNDDFTYDDYMINLKIFYSIRKKERSNIYAGPIMGVEFVNDPTFDLTTPFMGVLAGYEYYFGKKRRSSISIELGYIYGQKTYRKSYEANWGSVEYVGTFENNPLHLGLGYSYYF